MSTTPERAIPTYTAPDTTCANASDPLIALMRPGSATTPNVAYAPGISSALVFTPPTDTRITDFTLSVRHMFNTFTNSSGTHTQNNTGFTLVAFGGVGVSLTGQWDAIRAKRPPSMPTITGTAAVARPRTPAS